MAKLIRDLIEIPERVHQSDFVLRLSDGIRRPEETLQSYVVTEQLLNAFQQALDLVRRALESRSSMGAYLHGSFGSGKSHFMAVLHLLLQHNAEARSVPDLAPVVAKHAWTEGKRFLLVPYHLVGAESLEQAVLGRYVEHVRELHPEAPLPAVYRAEPIFENADRLRAQLGDEAFFRPLNEEKAASLGSTGGTVGTGWGRFNAGAWDDAGYAEARSAEPGHPRRLELVSALVTHHFPAYRRLAGSGGEAFVPLDEGLSVISKHAQALGYHGLVLFLDELVLWLASRVADLSFLSREGSKVAKLVESEASDRPVPIVSFIARQRDLRELVGDHLPGSEKLSFSDTLKWSEGRFETISLADRNLPHIARVRLLKPRNEEARQAIDKAFEETRKVRAEVLSTLLGREGNPESFRDVYPFSPVLVQALVAISSVLQRERTALRVMLQLLVNQRDTLKLGELVPLGDLFDVIAEGDEPFTQEMRLQFDYARKLYYQKLLPMLEKAHGVTRDEVRSLPPDHAAAAAFRGEDRIVKSLLLAALTPEVEALRGMTAGRLAALNHGSIRTPIPGTESRTLLARCRTWASTVPGIKVSEDPVNPTISIQLSGVDTEVILDKVQEDNPGNRKATIRKLLFEQLGLPAGNDLFVIHSFLWRGTQRKAEVVFANIRELPNESLRTRGEDWKVIVDFPFDEQRYTARNDLERLDRYRDQAGDQAGNQDEDGETATLCWVPAFFTPETQKALGTYVKLDFLLTGDRFNEYASHLSEVDRAQARALMDSQRSQLKQRLISCLEAAYGVIANPQPGLVEPGLELAERFQSLDSRFRPQPPAAANLKEALTGVLDQIFSYRFPKHPKFEVQVRPADLRKVLGVAVEAARTPQSRVDVEKELRPVVRQIANPLGLGEMHEAAFVLGDAWKHLLTRAAALSASADQEATVRRLRAAIESERGGLPREVQDLLILVFAEQTDRSFFQYNSPARKAELGSLDDDLELRLQQLPSQEAWNAARERAGRLFGGTSGGHRTASSVSQLRQSLIDRAQERRGPLSDLLDRLRLWMETFGVDAAAARRRRSARSALALVEDLLAAEPERVLEVLLAADFGPDLPDEVVANAGTQAKPVADALDPDRHRLLASLGHLAESGDPRQARAEAILGSLRDALARDQLAVPLEPVVRQAFTDATRLLAEVGPKPESRKPGWKVVERETREVSDTAAAEELFERLRGSLTGGRRLKVDWTLEEKEEP